MRSNRIPAAVGFTLIELTLVIVIGAILATLAGSRFFTQSVYSQRGYTEELGAAFRLAQKAAVASDCPSQVTVAAATYAVAQQAPLGNSCNPSDTTWSTAVVGIDGQAVSGTAPNGVTVSPTGVFVFSGSGALTSSPATSLLVGANTITIDRITGYVQVQ
jgi:prepilin-type N-terminal cleavage/methylation domain-containing protein